MGSILESALNPQKWCATKAGTLLAGVLGDNFGCDAFRGHQARCRFYFAHRKLTCRLKVCLVELQAKGAHPPGLLGCYGRVMWLQGNP